MGQHTKEDHKPSLTDERLGKEDVGKGGRWDEGAQGRISERSCRQRETSHYQEKGKFISSERFSEQTWLTVADSFLHLLPLAKGESEAGTGA